MSFKKITESDSHYDNLELKSSIDLLKIINDEDQSVALNVKNEIESINTLINKLVDQLNNGGRLFYIGSGTSGRLGVVDASECPPTFGVKSNLVNGIIAGGDKAIAAGGVALCKEEIKVVESVYFHAGGFGYFI